MGRRRHLEETRGALLDAGTHLLGETGVTATLDSISLVDACREAGLRTAGSGYKIWPSQAGFRHDLLRHLVHLQTDDRDSSERIESLRSALAQDSIDLVSLIRVEGGERFQRWLDQVSKYQLYLSLLLAAPIDPQIADALHNHDTSVVEHYAALYRSALMANGLEMRPPYTADHLAVTVSALLEGMTLRACVTPEKAITTLPYSHDETRPPTDWTLFAASVHVIVRGFTRPVDQPDPRAAGRPETSGSGAVASQAREPEGHRADRARHDQPEYRRRRTLDETRTLILETGARMVVDARTPVVFGSLDLLDVCRRAGLATSGSAYKIWETQEEFRVDLLRHLLATTFPGDSTISEVLDFLQRDTTTSFTELIRLFAAANFEMNDWSTTSVYVALWVASTNDDVLRQQLFEHDATTIDAFAEFYDVVRAHHHRAWTSPFTAAHLSVVLSALVQGFSIRAATNPEQVPDALMRPTGPDGQLQPWHLFACAAEAIITGFTHAAAR